MNRTVLVILLAAAAGAVGCGDHSSSVTLGHGALRVHAEEVTIEGSSGPDAHLLPGGVLKIGSDPVTLTPEQQASVEAFYDAAHAISQHGIETGKAGAQVGATAAKEVVSGLAHGDTSQIEAKVQASAAKVKEQALKICDDIGAMRSSQEALAGSLAAFTPYRVITESDVSGCRKDLKE